MEIEKEIKSTKFTNNYHRASINIIYTYNWLNNLIKVELDKSNITNQQFNILRILRGQHPQPATINILKERMLDKMCDASRIVDRLVQKELVTRSTNRTDRRSVDIQITDKGLELLESVHMEHAMIEGLKNNISDEEAQQLSNLLDKFRG
ncbi:MAG: MarR family transcriptional regulator [Bacteroidetes bacterium]|nr:MarR family transcriptional regulator [Bacteroidota bacterium]MBU1372342.1 MarR family transcriptional regulator [Bacteroidota bacterium]MBU1484714.1 MarR family transcriptional regulator [Bacteroidota bacterium]MBU1762124.1 MarR family transcriptional regulator [Bacteroidota bacterium]MBU2045223.1 MarR family transcriptional regulator [Bacteroidota bacterium]